LEFSELFFRAIGSLPHARWLIHHSSSFLCRSRPFAFFKIHFFCFRVLGVTPRRLLIAIACTLLSGCGAAAHSL
jgi:hypothetical protein